MFYNTFPFLFYIFYTVTVGPCQCHGSELLLQCQVDAAISCSIHMPILRLLALGVKSLRSKDTVPKCGKMFPIVPRLLFDYFALVISQIPIRKLIINYYLLIYKKVVRKFDY